MVADLRTNNTFTFKDGLQNLMLTIIPAGNMVYGYPSAIGYWYGYKTVMKGKGTVRFNITDILDQPAPCNHHL
jgi:hypothetical protein